MSLLTEIVAATAAGGTATILGHPLDCIKVRLQAAQRPDLSTLSCGLQMLRKEGPVAFSRGLGPPLANSVLMNTAMFVAFREARKRLPDGALGSLLSGLFSGVVTAGLSTPFDLVKIQAQLGVQTDAKSLFFCLARTHPRLLYTGHIANLGREGVFTAVYLGLYDALREIISGPSGPGLSLPLVAGTSATTGALAWVASYPFDVVKSLQQAQPPNTPLAARYTTMSAVHALHRIGGHAAFYRGVSASTARAVLVTCSRLVTYEFTKSWLPP